MTTDRLKEFAAMYDPQPMHLDEDAACHGPFSQLVASGWHTLCVTMKLMVEAKPLGDTPLVGAGVDSVSFKHPVLPNDELFVRAQVLSKKQSIKSGRAFVTLNVKTIRSVDSVAVLDQNWTLTLQGAHSEQ